jgi:hypothetical protein
MNNEFFDKIASIIEKARTYVGAPLMNEQGGEARAK